MAELMDPVRFGVKAMYLIGSTQNGTAGPQSDIDLLVHFTGTEAQEKDLMTWLDGWSLCLSYMNYVKTGSKTDGLLSVHLVTDQDIKNRSSYAVKITDKSEPALFIPLGRLSGGEAGKTAGRNYSASQLIRTILRLNLESRPARKYKGTDPLPR